MKFRSSHGLAVFALLALAPLARAVSITQTVTVSGTGFSPFGSGLYSASATAVFDRFNPANGPLQGVTITTSTTGHASATDLNIFAFQIGNNPSLSVQSGYDIAGAPFFSVRSAPTVYVKGPSDPDFIPPFSSVSYGFDFAQSTSALYASGIDPFVGSGSLSFSVFTLGRAGSSSGGSSISQTTTTTLTYIYGVTDGNIFGVPEGGKPLPIFACVLAICAVIHRRMSLIRRGSL
jgi:hypothetical protein